MKITSFHDYKSPLYQKITHPFHVGKPCVDCIGARHNNWIEVPKFFLTSERFSFIV